MSHSKIFVLLLAITLVSCGTSTSTYPNITTDIRGKVWNLYQYQDAASVMHTVPDSITCNFFLSALNDSMGGISQCNTFFSNFHLIGNTLIDTLATTLVDCPLTLPFEGGILSSDDYFLRFRVVNA